MAEVKEKKEEKKEDKKFDVRHLTPEEETQMMEEVPPPEGYAKGPVLVPEEKKEEEKSGVQDTEKKEEITKEVKADEKAEPVLDQDKVDKELAKPEGKADLTGLNYREKLYFSEMYRERKKRQAAEAERDKALFRESKLKQEIQAKPKEETPDPLDILKDRDGADFLTVDEVRKILTTQKAVVQKEPEAKEEKGAEGPSPLGVRYLKMCEKESQTLHSDFDAVMELTPECLENNSEALRELSVRVQDNGESPSEVMYDLIKNHADFDKLYPAADAKWKEKSMLGVEKPAEKPDHEVKKEEEAKAVEAKLQENQERSKTTAHVASREAKPAGELTMEEISQMKDSDFARLPRQVRQRYLKTYG